MENDFNKSDYSGNHENNGDRNYSGNDRGRYQRGGSSQGNNRGNNQGYPKQGGKPQYGGNRPQYGANKPQYGTNKPQYGAGKPQYGYQNKRKETVQNQEFPPDYEMRLNRFVSAAGVCSRREADKFIKAGVVTVNGEIITEMGIKVKMSDDIRYNGVKLIPEKKIYLVLNKPRNYITTANDPHADKTVMDLVRNAGNRRLFPVGRLDRHTTGVLIFTNDGDITKKLTHPKSNVKKIYHVFLDKPLSNEDFDRLSDGLDLDDGFFKPDLVGFVKDDDKRQLGIEIHSGRNRVVRRLFDNLGYRIKKLDRVFFAGVTKKKLGRGRWRFLSKQEVYSLQGGGNARRN